MKNRCFEAFFLLLTVGLLLFGLAACTQVPLPHSQQEESKQGQSQTVPEPSSGLAASSSSQGGKATQAPQSSMSQTVSASRTQAVSTSKPSALPAQSTISSSMAVSAPISSEKQTTPGGDSIEGTYRLFVKDREIATESKIELNYELRYAELPLIAIIKELGAKVEWQSKTIAKATIQERNYFLDTVKGTFVEEGNGFNLLTVAPGSKHGAIYRASGDEFIVDSDTAKLLLVNRMGAKININYEDKIVSIL